MSRKKVRRPYRQPETERSAYEHLVMRDNAPTLDRREVMDLVRGGEDSEVEFKVRYSNPERILAEIIAFANCGGGAILFGVSDTCRIEGLDNADRIEEELRDLCATEIVPPVHPFMNKVAFDNGRRVLVLEVDDRRGPHATRDGRYFIRVGATKREAEPDEIAELFQKYNVSAYEQVPLLAVPFDDVDEAGLWSYVRELFGDALKLPNGYPTAMAMTGMQLAVMTSRDYAPTVGGMVLFGGSRGIERSFPRCKVVASRFAGDAVTDPLVEQTTFTGNLASLYNRIEGFLARYIELCDQPPPRVRERGPARQRAAYSRPAVLEAVTNALTHRDYCSRQGFIRLMVFENRIEIANPAIGKRISRTGMDYGVSIPTNPRIKSFFRNAAYGMTTFNGGIPMIRRESVRFTRREPKFTVLPNEFHIEIPGI